MALWSHGVCAFVCLYECVWGTWTGVAALALLEAVLWINLWSSSKTLPSAERSVVITGCDSGFGHALALRLSGMGMRVFAGVLDSKGEGAQTLRDRAPGDFLHVLQLDVTNSEQVVQAQQLIHSQLGDRGLWGLVNNAGLLLCPVDAEVQSVSVYSRLLEVNFLSAVRVTQAFLPLLRRAKGRLVNVSSLAGDVPLPRFAAYAASKAALTSFSRILRLEMASWGVHVALIQPSGFRTNIFGSSQDQSHYQEELLRDSSPDVREAYGEDYLLSLPGRLSALSRQADKDVSPVLDDMVHALLSVRPRPLYAPGVAGWLLPFLHRQLPTALYDRLTAVFFRDSGCQPKGLRRN